jgi:hypothetical protein
MAEDTERVTETDLTPAQVEARKRFRERLAAAEQRMSRPGAWDELRAHLGLPPRTA